MTDSLREHLHRKGKVFYSGFDSYQSARIFFLGYNPGGDGDEILAVRVNSMREGSWNDFVDEDWAVGRKDPLQKRADALFTALGIDLKKEVFTSNLYFRNTPGIADTNSDGFPAFKPACWPVVNHFLAAVPASVVICNGNKTFFELLYWLDPERSKEPGYYDSTEIHKFGKNGKRGRVMSVQRQVHGRQVLIIGLPHLSWVPVANTASVVDLLKKLIAGHIAASTAT